MRERIKVEKFLLDTDIHVARKELRHLTDLSNKVNGPDTKEHELFSKEYNRLNPPPEEIFDEEEWLVGNLVTRRRLRGKK